MARLGNEQVNKRSFDHNTFHEKTETDKKYLVCKSCCIVCGGSVVVRDVQVVHWVTADHVVAEQRTLCPGDKVFKYFAGGKGIH